MPWTATSAKETLRASSSLLPNKAKTAGDELEKGLETQIKLDPGNAERRWHLLHQMPQHLSPRVTGTGLN